MSWIQRCGTPKTNEVMEVVEEETCDQRVIVRGLTEVGKERGTRYDDGHFDPEPVLVLAHAISHEHHAVNATT